MVVTCPQCKVRLKIDDSKVPPQGGRFKCPKCSTAIFVKPPETESPVQRVQTSEISSSGAVRQEALDYRKVLIAHGDSALLSEMERLVRDAGYIPVVSQDGIEAIVKASKELPFVAVLDVALPKEYGFDVCKKLKEIEYTKDIKVILVASVYDKKRYKRPPASLYGADEIIEDHELRELLIQKIEAFKQKGIPSEPPAHEEPAPKQAERPLPKGFDSFIPPGRETPSRPSEKVAKEIGLETEDELVQKARRLARTIISDIYFYNRKKFEEAVRKGTFYETFQEELKEGLKLYESRIPYEVRKKGDYFREEMDAFIESKRNT